MWYIFQISVAGGVAYAWTTLPGNSPKDFGHGLFLGAVVAWFATMLLSGIFDAINSRRIQRLQSSLLRGINRRSEKQTQYKVVVGRTVGPRPPKLVSQVGLRRSIGDRRSRST